MNLIGIAGGDSTENDHFVQDAAAGQIEYQSDPANAFEGTVTLLDGAKSGTYESEVVAVAAGAGATNGWVDDTAAPTLADGTQLTNMLNLDGDIYHMSIGINDHSFVVGESKTAADYQALTEFIGLRVNQVKGKKLLLNTLGRDTSGGADDDGANIVWQGQQDAIENSVNVLRGPDVYDLDLRDAKHHNQAGQEAKAEREQITAAFHVGNRVGLATKPALGPKIATATINVDEITLNLTHVRGSDITAPSSGAGGMDAEDDGTVMGATDLTRVDTKTALLEFPEQKAPLVGSTVELFSLYGADGNGLASLSPDVMKDNSDLVLPIQREIVTCTNADPIQELDNLVAYFDMRGSVRAVSGSDITSVTFIGGSVASGVGVSTLEPQFDATAFGNMGGMQFDGSGQRFLYSDSTAFGSQQSIGFVIRNDTAETTGKNMFAFANAGGGTDNQARFSTTTPAGTMYYTLNEVSATETLGYSLASSELAIIFYVFEDDDTLKSYKNNVLVATIDPRDDFNFWEAISIGARNAATDDARFTLGAWAHTKDIFTSTERTDIFNNWNARFSLGL
ncbi:MAG: hypothetical protein O7D95_05095 [Betaproteobacteria bacterium]|nr:hypothetical protein [Betaproteobacteria bacterium]